MTIDELRAARNAMLDAADLGHTRCHHVNAIEREYPDAPPAAITELLALHDAGECECVTFAPRGKPDA